MITAKDNSSHVNDPNDYQSEKRTELKINS